MKTLVAVVAVTVLFLAGLTYAHYQTTPPATSAADAVRNAEAAWIKALEAKSVERALAFYAPDAVTAGSAMFPAHGIADFRAAWAALFADPEFALTGKTETVVVTDNGSIAYTSGTWYERKKHGPYLAVWQKQPNGEWKVLIDSAWTMP